MQCNKALSDKFLVQNLGKTFITKEYNIHRKELLVQQQISRMPETMAAAEQFKRISAIETQMMHLRNEHKAAGKYGKELKRELFTNQCEFNALKGDDVNDENIEKYNKKKTTLEKELSQTNETQRLIHSNINKLLHDVAVIRNGGHAVGEAKKEEARKFIMPCPNVDCRGYLSSHYKCELCDHHTCSKCFDLIGLDKEESGHECKPENIESAEFIKKQSKPCPCCGTRISKIDGCDQMWCTQCHKAFSWNTGKIITGTIHNPHFYQYQREQGGGVAPRNPGDVVCGGLPNLSEILNKLRRANVPNILNFGDIEQRLLTIHRLQGHFTAFNVEPLRQAAREEQNYEFERIQYIVKIISREEMANKIIRKDKARKIKVVVLHVCELFLEVAIDMFQQILVSVKTGAEFGEFIIWHLKEYNNLREYCNIHFKEISMVYGVCVPFIKDNWTIDTSKYNSKGEVDKYIEKRDEQRRERVEQRKRLLQAAEVQRIEYNRRVWLLQQEQFPQATV